MNYFPGQDDQTHSQPLHIPFWAWIASQGTISRGFLYSIIGLALIAVPALAITGLLLHQHFMVLTAIAIAVPIVSFATAMNDVIQSSKVINAALKAEKKLNRIDHERSTLETANAQTKKEAVTSRQQAGKLETLITVETKKIRDTQEGLVKQIELNQDVTTMASAFTAFLDQNQNPIIHRLKKPFDTLMQRMIQQPNAVAIPHNTFDMITENLNQYNTVFSEVLHFAQQTEAKINLIDQTLKTLHRQGSLVMNRMKQVSDATNAKYYKRQKDIQYPDIITELKSIKSEFEQLKEAKQKVESYRKRKISKKDVATHLNIDLDSVEETDFGDALSVSTTSSRISRIQANSIKSVHGSKTKDANEENGSKEIFTLGLPPHMIYWLIKEDGNYLSLLGFSALILFINLSFLMLGIHLAMTNLVYVMLYALLPSLMQLWLNVEIVILSQSLVDAFGVQAQYNQKIGQIDDIRKEHQTLQQGLTDANKKLEKLQNDYDAMTSERDEIHDTINQQKEQSQMLDEKIGQLTKDLKYYFEHHLVDGEENASLYYFLEGLNDQLNSYLISYPVDISDAIDELNRNQLDSTNLRPYAENYMHRAKSHLKAYRNAFPIELYNELLKNIRVITDQEFKEIDFANSQFQMNFQKQMSLIRGQMDKLITATKPMDDEEHLSRVKLLPESVQKHFIESQLQNWGLLSFSSDKRRAVERSETSAGIRR